MSYTDEFTVREALTLMSNRAFAHSRCDGAEATFIDFGGGLIVHTLSSDIDLL